MALVTEQGYSLVEAAGGLDVRPNLIGCWRREFEEQASGARLGDDEKEGLKRPRKEVRQLRMERVVFKKTSQYFAKEMK